MESAGKQIEDEELRDAMKDSGLGTPATRAATIERLKKVGYIDMQGKKIMVTQKGRMAIELIRAAGIELLTSPEMTGHWERRLNEISRGTASDAQFMENVKKFASLIVDKVRFQARAAKDAFEPEAPVKKESRRSSQPKDKSPAAAQTSKTTKSAAVKTAPAHPSHIAACPRAGCGGTLFMGRKGYGCSHYKEGCSFVIWKESFGRMLTDAQVKALAEKGKTAKLKLVLPDGTEAEGKLVLKNPNTGELAVE
ncbi:DNA topoisomerase 3 [compost metagenome]